MKQRNEQTSLNMRFDSRSIRLPYGVSLFALRAACRTREAITRPAIARKIDGFEHHSFHKTRFIQKKRRACAKWYRVAECHVCAEYVHKFGQCGHRRRWQLMKGAASYQKCCFIAFLVAYLPNARNLLMALFGSCFYFWLSLSYIAVQNLIMLLLIAFLFFNFLTYKYEKRVKHIKKSCAFAVCGKEGAQVLGDR